MKTLAILTIGALLVTGCGEPKAIVDQLKLDVANQRTEIELLKGKLASAHAKIAELAPMAAKAKTLPVTVARKSAALDNSFKYLFSNQSGELLPIKVKFSNPTFGNAKTINLQLPPAAGYNAPLEIGHIEGWSGAKGDVLEITSEGYDPLTKKFE